MKRAGRMRLVRFVAVVVLICVGVWLAALTLGPLVLTALIERVTGGVVQLSHVKVSPRFDLSASSVNIRTASAGKREKKGLLIEDVDLSWSLRSDQHVKINFGSVNADQGAVAKGGYLTLSPTVPFGWSEFSIIAEVKRLSYDGLEAEDVVISSGLTRSDLQLTDIRADFSVASIATQAFASDLGNVSISISEIFPQRPLDAQSFEFEIRLLEGVKSKDIEAKTLLLSGVASSGSVSFNLNALDIAIPVRAVNVGAVTLEGSYDLAAGILNPNWLLMLEEFRSISPPLEIASYEGAVRMDGSVLEHEARGKLQKLDLATKDIVIAELADGWVDVVLRAVSGGRGPQTNLSVSARLSLPGDVSFELDLGSALDVASAIECLTKKCEISKLDADYALKVRGEMLEGKTSCMSTPCRPIDLMHRLSTTNTEAFMTSLADSKLFNPLVLPVAYMELRRGRENGAGHIIEY